MLSKKKSLNLFLCLFLVFAFSAFLKADCFTVLVGKKASSDGSVLFGHNEQYGGRRIVNYWVVPRIKHEPGELVKLKNGGTLPQVEETFAFIWLQNVGAEFGDSYFNEWGVVVSSDACPTREDSYEELCERGDITDGGITYMLRRLIAERAKTAREGVKIAGELLSRFGYSSSGRSYVIADPEEAWILAVSRGKNWIAQRCPDDEVVLLPNLHIIGEEADLNDKANVMASPGLIDYAVKRGWYDPGSGTPFSFKDAFNPQPRPGSFLSQYGCDPRQWYAQSSVLGKFIELPLKGSLPFSVKPARKITVADVVRILRSHSEGSPFDESEGYQKGSPHLVRSPANICSKTTQEGAVYQLRSWLPREIGCLVWRTTAAPCVNPLTPWYLGITETPESYRKSIPLKKNLDIEYHFNYPQEYLRFDSDFAFDVFNELENLVERDYKRAIKKVRHAWDRFEETQFELQPEIEKKALAIYQEDKEEARKFLTDYTHSRAMLVFFKAKDLISELKTWLWGY